MKKIFISGASGFVGSRLVEVLKEKHNTEVNVLLRNISKAARISRYQLNYFLGNITDEAVLEKAISGCDTLVHCAHDFSSDNINLESADIIAKLCLKHNVKRLVYISTVSVHLCNNEKSMNENSALNYSWTYAANKLQVEKKLLDYFHTQQLPVIILRPSVIYGPFAGVWTNGFVKELMAMRLIFPFNGNRICNAVYIDDVVQSIIRAIEVPKEFTGQAYLVSGADKVTWKEFINAYNQYPGLQDVVYWDDEQSSKWYDQLRLTSSMEIKPSLKKDPIAYLKSKIFYKIYQQLLKNSFFKNKLLSAKSKIPRPLKYPTLDTYEVFGCTAKVDLQKIQTELGYKPEYNLAAGMKKTQIYLNWFNLNSD